MSENSVEILDPHTPCRDCYFEITSKFEEKVTGIGCAASMLEKYKDCVVEAYDENGREFNIINGKSCLFRRGTQWGANLNVLEALEKAKKENEIRVELVVYIDHFTEKVQEKINDTINSCLTQKPKIKSITIVNNTKKDPLSFSDNLCNLVSKYDLPWKIKSVVEADATFERCCDLAIKESKNPYFMVCKAGFKFPDALEEINREINDNLKQVSFCKFGKNAYFGHTLIFKFLQGNAGDYTYENKIKEISKEQKTKDLIYKVKK